MHPYFHGMESNLNRFIDKTNIVDVFMSCLQVTSTLGRRVISNKQNLKGEIFIISLNEMNRQATKRV